MKKKKILWIVLAVLLLAGIFGAWYGFREFNRKHQDSAVASPDFEMTCSECCKSFSENDSSAYRKFAGKLLSIDGVLSAVENQDGDISVVIFDSSTNTSIRCSMDSVHAQDALKVAPGTYVNIKGQCAGFNKDELLGSDIILNRCALTVNKPKK